MRISRLKREWSVREIEIDVVELELLEAGLEGRLDALRTMIGVPELRGDEDFVPLDCPRLKDLLDFACQPFTTRITTPSPTACAIFSRGALRCEISPLWLIGGRRCGMSSQLYEAFSEPRTDRQRHTHRAPDSVDSYSGLIFHGPLMPRSCSQAECMSCLKEKGRKFVTRPTKIRRLRRSERPLRATGIITKY